MGIVDRILSRWHACFYRIRVEYFRTSMGKLDDFVSHIARDAGRDKRCSSACASADDFQAYTFPQLCLETDAIWVLPWTGWTLRYVSKRTSYLDLPAWQTRFFNGDSCRRRCRDQDCRRPYAR